MDTQNITEAFRKQPMQFIDVGKSRLAYRRFGQGPDVVFVHGWPLSSATFRKIVPSLAANYTCHLIDLPTAGQSEWKDDVSATLTAHADSLNRAIDALGLQQYAVVAHDSGAVIARLAAAGREDVRALVVSGSEIPGHRPWLVEFLAVAFRIPGALSFMRPILSNRSLRRSPLGFGGCFADLNCLDGEFNEFFIEPLLSSERALKGQAKLIQNLDWSLIDDLATTHARIRCPVRLIWGERDPFFPVTKAERTLGQYAGGAELDVIPGGKLFVHEEFPEIFAERTRHFLANTWR